MAYRGHSEFNNQFNNQFNRGGGVGSGIPPMPQTFPRMGGAAKSTSTSPLDMFEKFSKQVEDLIDKYFRPLKPFVPAIGRAFLVATFYEDTLRIISQWSEQVYYLHNYRKYWKWFTILFLVNNIVLMSVASTAVIIRKKINIATSALIFVVIIQGLGYGLIFDAQFILRNLSVVGGLVLAFADSIVRDVRSLNMPGLPMINNTDNRKYFLLGGRILLVLLFTGFVFSSDLSIGRILIILLGTISCVSIIVGYKTKFSAAIMSIILLIYNVLVNQFWRYGSKDSHRDFLKYEFFQILSIVGGLLLMVNAGAGSLSIDEKKKVY
ncbi:ER-derived vesicles protein ERV29 [Spathaspora sp. JA1]|nr:ER-derived vesicles protein ERV29 [Spathaspora sp. JA1]